MVPLGRIGRPDDAAGLTLFLASRAGAYLTGTVIPLDGNPSSMEVVATGRPIIVAEAQTSPLTAPIHDLMRARRTQSLLIAPLLVRGEVIGTIGVDTDEVERGVFTPADLTLMETIAGQIAGAIENARLFEEMQKAKEAADSANVAKSTFLANMSHELRTPLNAVLGFAQLMERDPALPDHQKEHLGIITRSGEHLLGLINSVLEMSKIEAGRVTLNEAPFDLARLLRSVEELFQLRAEARHLWLRFEVAPEVPQYVVGDESKLRQVLINLLGNAIKFTHQGGVTLRVSSELRVLSSELAATQNSKLKTQNWLCFEVEDTGEGIADDQIAHLFQPFVQAASGGKAQEGTGLGLALSRQFVRLMGGDIKVASALGQGSVFAFDVRVRPADPAHVQHGQSERWVLGVAAADQREYRMLVVDDKWENRRLLVEWLRGVGFVVREAANGQEAIDEWQRWAPHMIWMDMRMPVMDGYEATRRIKSGRQGQPTVVIALTASAFEHEHATVIEAGCDDFVRKPVREATVFERIAQHLGVQFLYDEPPPAAALDQAIDLSPASLTALPASWLASLQQAADEVDTEMANAVIAQIREYDAPLADGLADLVASYRFDKLQTLIHEVSAHHDSVKHS